MGHSAPISPDSPSRSSPFGGLPANQAASERPSDSGELFRKFQRNWEDYGWYITAKKALAYLVRAIYFRQVYRIYRINLEDAEPPKDWEVSPFKFKMLSPQNDSEIEQIEEIAEWLQGRLKAAIADSQPCLVAMDGDRVAGFNLIRLDRATLVLVNLTRKLHAGCAWSEHIAVRREYRRSGLGAQLRYRIFEDLKRRGVRRLYGGTLVTNVASLNLARSVGFTEVADVHYLKILSVEKWRCDRVRR